MTPNQGLLTSDFICNICGSGDYRSYLSFKGREIVICKGCRTYRTFPYPRMDYEEHEFYCEHYLENEPLFRNFASGLIRIVQRHKNTGRLLDIGCAVGLLLEEARKAGFEAEGMELNRKAAAISRQKGFNINATFSVYSDACFEVIVLNHILEHIARPDNFLKDIRRIIKKEGVLIVGVPNHDSLVARLCRKSWYGWGIPEHIWHFDRKSLNFVLSRSGFTAKEIIQNSQYYPFSGSLRKNTRAVIARFGRMLGSGDQLIVVAEVS